MERRLDERTLGCLATGAIAAAPLLALLIGPDVGLVVATAALGAAAGLCLAGSRREEGSRARLLFLAATFDGLLAVACLAALIVRHAA